MPQPFAICIENLNARSGTSRYLRCVALPGRQPGLRLDGHGRVLWRQEGAAACELWVSADDHLILYRQPGMAPVTVQRAGRSLVVPFEKPVVLADQDQLRIGRRRLRVHIHGTAAAISAPSPLPASPGALQRLSQAAATAAVVGSVVAAAGCARPTPTIDVREAPPEPVMAEPTPTPTIEVRDAPPAPVMADPTPTLTPVPAPIIEVRDMPPTAEAPVTAGTHASRTIGETLQGEWIAAQVIQVGQSRTWITGTLTIEEDMYTFAPAGEIPQGAAPGEIDFLFAHPQGEVVIDRYAGTFAPDETLDVFVPGLDLAHMVFRSGGQVVGQYWVRVRDATSLELYRESGPAMWRITKLIGE